jgi:hypothetical protein
LNLFFGIEELSLCLGELPPQAFHLAAAAIRRASGILSGALQIQLQMRDAELQSAQLVLWTLHVA